MIDPGLDAADPVAGSVYAGIEAIRINEIMPRPVWRVEAETSVNWDWAIPDSMGRNWAIASSPTGEQPGSGTYLIDPWPIDYMKHC